MTDQEWYDYGQAHCGIGVGDKVEVLMKAESKKKGWRLTWNPHMDGFVGQILTVKLIDKENGFNCSPDNFWFPFFVLELIEKAKPEPSLPQSILDIIGGTDFGCAKEAIKKLVAEILKQKQKG